MTKAGKTSNDGRYRFYGIEEQGLWVLLLVAVIIQVACAFGAGSDGAGDNRALAEITPLHGETLLAKK